MRQFLEAICAEPGEPLHWLALADWLEEQGDQHVAMVRAMGSEGGKLATYYHNYPTTVGVGCVGHSGGPRSEEYAVRLSFLPDGGWGLWQPFGDTQVRFQDGLEVIFFLRDTYVPPNAWDLHPGWVFAGTTLQIRRPKFFRDIENLEGHDICSYCGCDNTRLGGREGWDCLYCGGN